MHTCNSTLSLNFMLREPWAAQAAPVCLMHASEKTRAQCFLLHESIQNHDRRLQWSSYVSKRKLLTTKQLQTCKLCSSTHDLEQNKCASVFIACALLLQCCIPHSLCLSLAKCVPREQLVIHELHDYLMIRALRS